MRARPRSCMHGHVRIFTRISSRPWRPPRPASGSLKSSANPVRSNTLKLRHISADLRIQPAYSNPLGGMGMASPRNATRRRHRSRGSAFKPARRPAPAAQGVDPRGIWTGWTRQKSAGAAPDRAGRMTDHAGQARRHACATPLGYRTFIFPSISLKPSLNMVFVSFWPSISTSSLPLALSSLPFMLSKT